MTTIDMTKHVNGNVLKAFGADILSYEKGITDAIDAKVDTLVGSDTGKSARAIAAEEVAVQLVPENANEALDTLQEIAAWIQAHPGDASAMNTAIGKLQAILAGIGGEGNTYATVVAALDDKVDKSAGYGLSKNDFTDALLTKLNGIQEGATAVAISAALTAGVEVGTITINGVNTKLYVAADQFLTVDEAHAIFAELTTPAGE